MLMKSLDVPTEVRGSSIGDRACCCIISALGPSRADVNVALRRFTKERRQNHGARTSHVECQDCYLEALACHSISPGGTSLLTEITACDCSTAEARCPAQPLEADD
jgi:hypothetical protein